MKRSATMGGIAAIVILGSLVAGGVIWSTLSRNGVNESSSLATETADRAETREAVQGDPPAWRFEDLLLTYDTPRDYAYRRLLSPSLGAGGDREPALRLDTGGATLTLVNYWATWCAPCKEEMPSLDALAETFAEQGLHIIATSIDTSAERPFAWAEAEGIRRLEIAFDANEAEDPAAPLTAVPTTFLVDAQGMTFGEVAAPLDWNSEPVRRWVSAYLEQRQSER